jgi:hypothetical protein
MWHELDSRTLSLLKPLQRRGAQVEHNLNWQIR